MRLLLVRGGGDRDDVVLSWVQCAGDATDGAALAGRVDALEDQHQRAAPEALVLRKTGQLRLLPLEFPSVVALPIVWLRSRSRISLTLSMTAGAAAAGRCESLPCRSADWSAGSRGSGVEQDVAHGEVAVAPVGALDDVPGCLARRRLAQRVLPQAVRFRVRRAWFQSASVTCQGESFLRSSSVSRFFCACLADGSRTSTAARLHARASLVLADRRAEGIRVRRSSSRPKARLQRLGIPGVHVYRDMRPRAGNACQ